MLDRSLSIFDSADNCDGVTVVPGSCDDGDGAGGDGGGGDQGDAAKAAAEAAAAVEAAKVEAAKVAEAAKTAAAALEAEKQAAEEAKKVEEAKKKAEEDAAKLRKDDPAAAALADMQARLDKMEADEGEELAGLKAQVETQRKHALSQTLDAMGVRPEARQYAPDVDVSTEKGRADLAKWAEENPFMLAEQRSTMPPVDLEARMKDYNSPHLVNLKKYRERAAKGWK